MAMLPRAWPLHDIACTESFCAALATKVRRELTHDQRERLLADLISATWELSLVYQPTVGKVRFTTFATHHHKRITIPGWLRKEFGRTKWQFSDRTHTRILPTFEPLDGLSVHPRLRQPEEDRAVDLLRILTSRDQRSTGSPGHSGNNGARKAA